MNEQEIIERVAIALHTADGAQVTFPLTWASTSDYARAEFRTLAKAAIAEYRRIQEEQEGTWRTLGIHANGGIVQRNSVTQEMRIHRG